MVLAITLAITYWASKRTKDATTFWAAGRGITGVQNGFAIAGDYMSAASFLGIAGLIFLFGFDGFLYSVGFLVAFLIVLYLLAERMRNAGKFTIADVLSFRLNERPARVAAALGTLVVAGFYLIAQMVGAGALIELLVGINFNLAVILLTGGFMLMLRDLRRHAGDDLGADHQGGAADDGDDRALDLRARQDRLEPDRHLRQGRGAVRGRRGLSRAGPAVHRARSTRSRSGSGCCSEPPACHTS